MSDRAYRQPVGMIGTWGVHRGVRAGTYALLIAAALTSAALLGSAATRAYCSPRESTPLCLQLRSGPTFEDLHVPFVVENLLATSPPLPAFVVLASCLLAIGLLPRVGLAIDVAGNALLVRRGALLRRTRTERLALEVIAYVAIERAWAWSRVVLVDREGFSRRLTGWRLGRGRDERIVSAIEAAQRGALERVHVVPTTSEGGRHAARVATVVAAVLGLGVLALVVGGRAPVHHAGAGEHALRPRADRGRTLARGADGVIRVLEYGRWLRSDQPVWDAYLLDRLGAERSDFPVSPLRALSHAEAGELIVDVTQAGCFHFHSERVRFAWTAREATVERHGLVRALERGTLRKALLSMADAAEGPDDGERGCTSHLTSTLEWQGDGVAGNLRFDESDCDHGEPRGTLGAAHRVQDALKVLPYEPPPAADWVRGGNDAGLVKLDRTTGISETMLRARPRLDRASVDVFTRTRAGWIHEAQIVLEAPRQPGFGRAVALAGDTLAVSDVDALAMEGDTIVAGSGDADSSEGAVFVLQKRAQRWTLEATLRPATPRAQYQQYGSSVSLSGDTIAVGARDLVDVYARDGGAWQRQQRLRASDDPMPAFGDDVALRGDLLLVGAPSATRRRTYRRTNGRWSPGAPLELRDPVSGESLDADSVLMGEEALIPIRAHGERTVGVQVFALRDGRWEETRRLAEPRADLGGRLAVTADFAASIGAPRLSMSRGERDRVLMFARGAPVRVVAELRPSARTPDDRFGSSIALDGRTLAVGAPGFGRENATVRGGAVFVWEGW